MTSPWYRAALRVEKCDGVECGGFHADDCSPFRYAEEWELAIANLGRCLRDAGALSASYWAGRNCSDAVNFHYDPSWMWQPGCGRSMP